MSSTIIITGYTDSVGIAMFFLVMAISAESVCSATMWTIISDVVPGKLSGSVGGLLNSVGAMGITGPYFNRNYCQSNGQLPVSIKYRRRSDAGRRGIHLVCCPRLRLLEEFESLQQEISTIQ